MTSGPEGQLVEELAAVLGWRLVAYATGARSVEEVQGWAAGALVPDSALQRLQLAHAVVQIVTACDGAVVARTWFAGLNPALDDRSPATLIREGAPASEGPLLLAVSRSFAGEASPVVAPIGELIAEAYGDGAERWLDTPRASLGGRTPREALAEGAEDAVRREVIRTILGDWA